MTNDDSKCGKLELIEGPISLRGKCCCICANHYPDYKHPWLETKGWEVIGPHGQIGWACVIPEYKVCSSRWTKHGICELFQDIKE